MSALEEKIKRFADWDHHTAEVYVNAAKKLITLGMTENEAVDFLETLYFEAADDFGG